jgi:hypothetical protein
MQENMLLDFSIQQRFKELLLSGIRVLDTLNAALDTVDASSHLLGQHGGGVEKTLPSPLGRGWHPDLAVGSRSNQTASVLPWQQEFILLGTWPKLF